ncbi:MAG: hypothetical protein IPM58_07350 [Nitrospira sp.]|nr:hypothetical protein [Nitrospira sp.]
MNLEDGIYEQIKLFLPKYLSPDQTRDLFSELSRFPDNMAFYLNRDDLRDELLQGDGWRGLIAINFLTGERKTVSGAILSNSCDIDSSNTGSLPVNVLFAPLIELRKFTDRLRGFGKTEDQIQNTVITIKKQQVTNIFYLPECHGSIPESLILLGDIHSHPLQHFLQQSRQPLFKLNQYAFYLFLIKLSIHFSRFQEGVQRCSSAA